MAEALPESDVRVHFFDKDALADGIGGWDNEWARERTDAYVHAEIEADLERYAMKPAYVRVGPKPMHAGSDDIVDNSADQWT